MKKISNINQLQKKLDKIRENVEQPPFHFELYIDTQGHFGSRQDIFLTPEEALRLGKFLVKFYKDA